MKAVVVPWLVCSAPGWAQAGGLQEHRRSARLGILRPTPAVGFFPLTHEMRHPIKDDNHLGKIQSSTEMNKKSFPGLQGTRPGDKAPWKQPLPLLVYIRRNWARATLQPANPGIGT